MNSVILIGNLARDPEKSMTGTGMTVARFTIAVNRQRKSPDGQDEADFIRITTFGKQADLVMQYLSKGRKVAVEGRIQTGSYQDKEGKKVYTTDVIGNRVEFLSPKDGGGSGAYGGQFDSRPAEDFAVKPPSATASESGDLPVGFDDTTLSDNGGDDEEMPF